MIRIFMIPIFIAFFMIGQYMDVIPYADVIAMIIFIVAAATDGIDGHIARKYNQVTDFGKFVDPLADKILVISAMLCMIEFGWLSSVAVIIIIAREFMVTGLRTVAMGSGKVIAAGFSGKLKTVIQIAVIVLIMVVRAFDIYYFTPVSIAVEIGVWLMVFITVYSGCEYMVKNWSVIDFKK